METLRNIFLFQLWITIKGYIGNGENVLYGFSTYPMNSPMNRILYSTFIVLELWVSCLTSPWLIPHVCAHTHAQIIDYLSHYLKFPCWIEFYIIILHYYCLEHAAIDFWLHDCQIMGFVSKRIARYVVSHVFLSLLIWFSGISKLYSILNSTLCLWWLAQPIPWQLPYAQGSWLLPRERWNMLLWLSFRLHGSKRCSIL